MALSSIIKTSSDSGTIGFIDGTAVTPLTLTARFDAGDFALSGLSKVLREVATFSSRGATKSIRYGAPKYPTGSFSVMVSDISETGTGTLIDWLQKTTSTPFENRVSTLTSISECDFFHVVWTQEGTTYGDGADQTIKAKDCMVTEWSIAEGEPNKISVSFTVYGDVLVGATVIAAAPR